MKKRFVMVQILLSLALAFSTAINSLAQNETKTNPPNYIIARYVIGSGGVIGATGTNHFHLATAGETVVGGSQNTNNFLLSGYWHTGVFGPTDVQQQVKPNVPTNFELHQNYPNPFNPQTTIEYDLPAESRVTVEILNLMGQKIRLLMNSQQQGPGFIQVAWNGCDDQGNLMGSGIYIYRVSVYPTDDSDQKSQMLFHQSKKMLFVK
jgi:hypothetical protein